MAEGQDGLSRSRSRSGADEVKQGKTKLADAAKKVAAKKLPPPSPSCKRAEKRSKDTAKSNLEMKRHDEWMKNAKYKLEAFVRDYSDMAEWKELIEAIKRHPEFP